MLHQRDRADTAAQALDRLAHLGVRPAAAIGARVTSHVVVVGAGWAGLAAAVELLAAGTRVTLIDAAPQVGGRARRVSLDLGDRTSPSTTGST